MKKGLLYTFIGAFCWGFSGTCGQYLFSHYHISSMWLTTLRMMIAGLLITLLCIYKYPQQLKELFSTKKDILELCIVAICGFVFVQYSYLTTIQYSNAPTATVIQYLYPIILVMFVCIMNKRFPYKVELICIILAVLGTFIIATHGSIHTLSLSLKALIWGLLSALAAMLYTILPVRLMNKYGSLPIVGIGMLIGGIVLTVTTGNTILTYTLPTQGYLALLGIAVIGTAFAYSLYLYGVTQIGPVNASMIASIEPVSAALCSFVWLHTVIEPIDCIGFIMIMLTVFILAKEKTDYSVS